ncbi:Predicted TIM-barrel enzyme [Paracoccus alcaliphilus]|uniref:Predicted TIM-barrel enzyme n=1 Tax=Paracoccus alcaliphilus TaxID=34002 RepID=A0A1H8ND78_9RHOB|nr:phosphoenolpyruvate hydrolase family protein [Paracoccus alcaliphilus]WCR18613.1 phosphoenolpyruvate hydrolase family protein [Paracoccus alcaliphilus]SEO27564.1 Predicted TIM-barrel enzyme [Paracoccus alcaliphilus]
MISDDSRRSLIARAERRLGSGEPLVGAAVGAGLAAQAAVQGSADFILALNAGRYRMMGAASIAAMLPLADANDFTDDFAQREILGTVAVPVLRGVSAFDPRLDLARLAAVTRQAGYAGIANFPTVIHHDGQFRQALEEAGMGFSREIALMREARAAGLATLAYVKTRDELEAMTEVGPDVLCLNFGWNAGGMRDVAQEFTLDEAADRARHMFRQLRRTNPDILCLLEGGPIISPGDMFRVWQSSEADGYLGGSTLDRMPLERAIIEATSAFKTVGALRAAESSRSRTLTEVRRLTGIFGHSDSMNHAVDQISRLAGLEMPVLVLGEPGSGRINIARSLHTLSRRAGGLLQVTAEKVNRDPEAILLGRGRADRRAALLRREGGTLIFSDAGQLRPEALQIIHDWAETTEPGAERSRAILIGRSATEFDRETLRLFRAALIEIPPLRDRPEDILPYLRQFLMLLTGPVAAGPRPEISPDALRRLLSHSWPGNIRELRRVAEGALARMRGNVISATELAGLIDGPDTEPAPAATAQVTDEAEWLLDALRRNRFRKGDTANFLGISRKTLYNRMKALRIGK